MAKVPGVTTDLLQKQILKLLEEIGIPAKEWIGQGGTKLKRLVTKTGISPFKPNMIGAMSQEKKTFGDALDAFSNEAKFMMNANDQELMNFKNNIIDFTNYGGKPRGPEGEGLASMMKTLDDLGSEAKNLKTSAEEMKDLALKNIKDLEDSLKYGGDPFKVPDKTSFGGTMYNEGNMRTALREFLQTELKNGKLKLNKNDTFRVKNYMPTSEDDPILVFQKIYGDKSLKKIEEIVNVFEKGESFKHYEQLLRENVDDQFLKPLNKENVGEGTLVLDESMTYKEKLPDDDDIPFNLGGRVGLRRGTSGAPGGGDPGMMGTGDSYGDSYGEGRTHSPHEGLGTKDPFKGAPPGLRTDPTHRPKTKPKWGKTKAALRTILPFVTPQTLFLSQLPTKVHMGIGAIKSLKKIHELYSIPDEEETHGPAPLYATGGRVGLKYGTKKLFNFTKKQLLDAVNDIFPTGDRKYDAEMVSDALVENNPKMFKNKLRDDLSDNEYTEIYGIALDALDAFNAEARKLMKGKKGVGSLVKTTEKPKIDWSDPEIKMAMDKAGQKGIALSDAAKIMGYDMSKQKDYFSFEEAISAGMEGWPKEVKEQVIRAKYGNVVDDRLLNNMLIDDDPFRLAEVMATVDQGLLMQEKGMGGEEILTAIKADLKREPNAAGGGVGSLFSPTDRVGLYKGSVRQYAATSGKKIKEILDDLMKHKKIRDLVEQVNNKLHETGIAKMFYQDRTLTDKDKIIASRVIAPFVETVDKLIPWKTTDKSARNATLNWFRESLTNPKYKKVYHPDWEEGKTVFRGMKHPEDIQYSKEHPSNMFMTKEHTKMFKPENVGAFASESPSHAISFAAGAKGFPHVKKTHLSPLEFQESVERNILENPYGVTSDVILDAEKKAALETDIVATGIAAFKKYWPFSKGGPVSRQKVYEDGVASMFKEV